MWLTYLESVKLVYRWDLTTTALHPDKTLAPNHVLVAEICHPSLYTVIFSWPVVVWGLFWMLFSLFGVFRTFPMRWTLQNSQTRWTFTPSETDAGTSRQPVPPPEMVSTKDWSGCRVSSRTIHNHSPPKMIHQNLCLTLLSTLNMVQNWAAFLGVGQLILNCCGSSLSVCRAVTCALSKNREASKQVSCTCWPQYLNAIGQIFILSTVEHDPWGTFHFI